MKQKKRLLYVSEPIEQKQLTTLNQDNPDSSPKESTRSGEKDQGI